MLPAARLANTAVILALAMMAGCERRSRTTIYILNRDVQAGEVFDQTIVDEITFTDATGYYDVRRDFDFVTRSTLDQHVGQYFSKDLPRFTPITADVLTQTR